TRGRQQLQVWLLSLCCPSQLHQVCGLLATPDCPQHASLLSASSAAPACPLSPATTPLTAPAVIHADQHT
ncbi:hypothetical protein SRHO_G00221920, partial [Serrasalmus rhombeus]